MGLPNQGDGVDQFKAQVIQWIREEIAKAAQGGANGSLHIDGATGNLVVDRGDIRSGNYVAGTSGWDLAPSGAAELGPTTVRGGTIKSGNYVAGTSGWGLDGAGNAEFSGAVTIDGSLTIASGLLNGITYIQPAFGFNSASNYAIPAGQASRVTRTSFTFTVPTGFTQALITATTADSATNSTAGFDFLNSYVQISAPGQTTHFSFSSSATVPAGYYADTGTHMTTLYTGLTAGTVITVASQPYTTTTSWASSTANATAADGTSLFLR